MVVYGSGIDSSHILSVGIDDKKESIFFLLEMEILRFA